METFQIEHLTFTYPGCTASALTDVSFAVRKGAFFVLCGHSGSGKSTLLRQLKPAISPHGTRTGNILFDGKDLAEWSDAESAARIGFVTQSPENQIVTDKVWHELAFGAESLGYDSETIRRRCAEMASFFGFENLLYQNISELSGGQKQLLCLASVMTMQPDVLILDEPTSQLDPVAASEFLGTLAKINRELGTTVILSEHRLEDVLSYASECAVMENGSILCSGTVESVGQALKAQNSPMFAAMPCAMRVWASVETDLPCPVTINEGRTFLSRYLCGKTIHPLPEPITNRPCSEPVVSLKEVWFRYEKDSPDVVKGLDLSAYAGELLCILGANGTGKTTTLKLLASNCKAYRGEIVLGGKTALLPQDPQTVFVKKTVYEDLADVLKQKKLSVKEVETEIMRVASLCRIGDLLSRHPFDLSGGEQERAALAKMLLLSPDVLLLDEPTKGLDVLFKEEFASILSELKHAGICIVMVTHDTEFCAKNADVCGLFFDGRLTAVSDPRSFFAGNSFYTTAANRMAREIEPRAITSEDVIAVIGGTPPAKPQIPKAEAGTIRAPQKETAVRPLPLWRKICAWIAGLSALFLLFYTAANQNLRELVGGDGTTPLGKKQLLLYGAFLLCLLLLAVLIGRRSTKPARIPPETKKQKLSGRTLISAVMILLLIPLTLFFGIFMLDQKQYYLIALAVLTECMLPFFLVFEGRKPKARELVLIATLCALGIAGRAAFFMFPQFKPMMALAILSGVAFGGETGFLVGAVTMLVSNVLFSQGPWTPFQMFAMGMIGFLAGILYGKGILARSRLSLCVFGVISTFVIYGGLLNPAAALIWGNESLNWKVILGYYVTGFPMDAVHAAATALFLWFGADPMLEKLERVKTKYELM